MKSHCGFVWKRTLFSFWSNSALRGVSSFVLKSHYRTLKIALLCWIMNCDGFAHPDFPFTAFLKLTNVMEIVKLWKNGALANRKWMCGHKLNVCSILCPNQVTYLFYYYFFNFFNLYLNLKFCIVEEKWLTYSLLPSCVPERSELQNREGIKKER